MSLGILVFDKRLKNKDMRKMETQKFDIQTYVQEKLKLQETTRTQVDVLRRMYRDYDIGTRNFELYKVKTGKRWYSKCDRRK